jgi:MFS family permease
MRESFELLRHEPRSRVFFLALAQSAIGTGAGYVALLLIAYGRFDAGWKVGVVLLADLIPAMALGPLFGAIADRWSRKWCTVAGDVLRVVGFAGVALVDGFVPTLLFALIAGLGTAAFTPAALAALPSVVDDKRRVPATTSLYGVMADLGFTVGPAAGAALLVVTGPETVMYVNAVTFAISAALLAVLRFGGSPERTAGGRRSLGFEVREGLGVAMRIRPLRILLLASGAGLFCAGIFNVLEVFYAREHLGTSESGLGVLVAFFGAGFIIGSLRGASGGAPKLLKRRYLEGLAVAGLALVATGLVASFELAAVTFVLAGYANGLLLVYERLLIQSTVRDAVVGRVFGVKEALTAWAFGIAFLTGGALVSTVGVQDLILAAGALALAVFAAAAVLLRGEWTADVSLPAGAGIGEAVLYGGADVAGADGRLGEHGADVVGR